MAAKKETVFTSGLKKDYYHLYPEGWFYKISDSFPPKNPDGRLRFTIAKPFDVIMSHDNITYAIEIKVHSKHTAWPTSAVSEHQRENLQKFLNASDNHGAFVLVNVEYDGDRYKTNFIARVDLFDLYRNKSLRVNELRKKSIERKRIDCAIVWAINDLFMIDITRNYLNEEVA